LFDPSGNLSGTEILGINNVGSIVGVYTEANGSGSLPTAYVFLGTAPVSGVPEPATFFLSGLAITGLAFFQVRRKSVRQ
jgi:hypothetical protein